MSAGDRLRQLARCSRDPFDQGALSTAADALEANASLTSDLQEARADLQAAWDALGDSPPVDTLAGSIVALRERLEELRQSNHEYAEDRLGREWRIENLQAQLATARDDADTIKARVAELEQMQATVARLGVVYRFHPNPGDIDGSGRILPTGRGTVEATIPELAKLRERVEELETILGEYHQKVSEWRGAEVLARTMRDRVKASLKK